MFACSDESVENKEILFKTAGEMKLQIALFYISKTDAGKMNEQK